MPDINNLSNNLSMGNVTAANVKNNNTAENKTPSAQQAQAQIDNSNQKLNHPAEVLGRSQVQNNLRINKDDNFEADMKFLSENPDAVQLADVSFGMIYAKQVIDNEEYPYEKACEIYSSFARELS